MLGKSRTLNGYNENPTPNQYMSAHRKLLNNIDDFVSEHSNITPQSSCNIFTVSSFNSRSSNSTASSIEATQCVPDEEDWIEMAELEALEQCSHLTDMHDSGISYAAYMLETRLLTSTIHCKYCRDVLQNNEKLSDSMCVNFRRPCKSTYQLCKLTDIVMKTYINTGSNFKPKVYFMVMNNIDFEQVFPDFYDPVHDIDHKHFLIKYFIDEYINRKCAYLAKQKTIALHKRYVRNKLRKMAHYMGQ